MTAWHRLHSASGLWCEMQPNGALRRIGRADDVLGLFVGNAVEAAPANLWLRLHAGGAGDVRGESTDGGGHAGQVIAVLPLLGPGATAALDVDAGAADAGGRCTAHGSAPLHGLRWQLTLQLAQAAPAWFWHLALRNDGAAPLLADVVLLQDVALAPYAAVRLNEYYVSHYVDLAPLRHEQQGWVVAARQNLALGDGRNPWALMGSLRRAVSFATDGRQVGGAQHLRRGLPGALLQHEHALIGLQDAPQAVAPGGSAAFGFFGRIEADHPLASGSADLAFVQATLQLHEAAPPAWRDKPALLAAPPPTLFSTAPLLQAQDLATAEIDAVFGSARRHAEWADDGTLLSFFRDAGADGGNDRGELGGPGDASDDGGGGGGTDNDGDHAMRRHVVLRAKEAAVLRPHGHILRSGTALVPDETALTSTVWMAGVFHSMLTQGHVSTNRLSSTVRGYLGQFRSQGLRMFVRDGMSRDGHGGGGWQQLGVPSAFEIAPDGCRWLYRHDGGLFSVHSTAQHAPQAMALRIDVLHGPPLGLRICQHIALAGDDGSDGAPACWRPDGAGVAIEPPAGSVMAERFPGGSFQIDPAPGSRFDAVGGAALLFDDAGAAPEAADAPVAIGAADAGTDAGTPAGTGATADAAERAPQASPVTPAHHCQPYVCIDAIAAPRFGLLISGRLVAAAEAPQAGGDMLPLPLPRSSPLSQRQSLPVPRLRAPPASTLSTAVAQLDDALPWFLHNALVHYLAPRGLEQYSGGGWGTRDVCQGPLELLLACGRTAPVRDLLLRTFAAQNDDGDWPQWFMFFARDRAVRAGDSHGDIVFWPLLALAQYLLASGDAGLLDTPLPFHQGGEPLALWGHVQRALGLICRRRIPGTGLAAYWHGDWNDALQPADPRLRDRMCSAWTVTLHHQMLLTLAAALRGIGRAADAAPLEADAARVDADFQRLLVVDGVVAGYALFDVAVADGDSGGNAGADGNADGDAANAAAQTPPRLLLHPSDTTTGLHYSLLPMVHAVLQDMLTPAHAAAQLALIERHLTGPDGARLFDAPMAYRGGPQTVFQRAESSAYFGREIGVMYMHAHLRYAQALAHVGHADAFFAALRRAHPVGLQALVPSAAPRQSNCYYSSSDAAFASRREASADYAAVNAGTVALEGGWRIYSSGPGIALALVMRHFVGIVQLQHSLLFDPVLPPTLDGLQVDTDIGGRALRVTYRVGAAGCGVRALALNGRPLAFTRGANRYRSGGAVVQRADFDAASVTAAGPAAAADAVTRPLQLLIDLG